MQDASSSESPSHLRGGVMGGGKTLRQPDKRPRRAAVLYSRSMRNGISGASAGGIG